MAVRENIAAEISALLEGGDTYRCLPTVPGIGPKAAPKLAISIDIEDFPNHDGLASYCGLAPRNRRSGTSISSVAASRQGNKRLKNLLMFSCNCLTRAGGEMGRLLRQVPRAGNVARQGAQGAGAEKAEGHLRGHAGQGALRRLVEALRTDWSPPAERPDASMSRFSLTNGIPQLTKL